MAKKLVEVVCEGPHCDEEDCKCNKGTECPDQHCVDDSCRCRNEFDRELFETLDEIWRETGPENERFYAHGWQNTDLEPWHSISKNLIEWKVWKTV